MKGEIAPSPVITNAFLVEIAGIAPFYARKFGSLTTEVSVAEAPDTTKHSGGRVLAGESTMETPMHHDAEEAQLEAWLLDCKIGAPGYKRVATVKYLAADGEIRRVFEVAGMWLTKRELPELDKTADDVGFITWTFSYDDVEQTF